MPLNIDDSLRQAAELYEQVPTKRRRGADEALLREIARTKSQPPGFDTFDAEEPTPVPSPSPRLVEAANKSGGGYALRPGEKAIYFVKRLQAAEELGLGSTTFDRLAKEDPHFPQSFRVGGQRMLDRADLEAYKLRLKELGREVAQS